MRYIFHYVLRNLNYNKKNSVLTLVLYFFATLFFITQTLILLCWNIQNRVRIENTYGVHDGVFALSDESALDIYPEITDKGIIEIKDSGVKGVEYADHPIIIGYADDNALKLHRLSLYEGRFPEKSNEIAIEKSLLNLLYSDIEVGDKIGFYTKENKYTELTLSGIVNNFSSLQWNVSPPMINAIVSSSYKGVAKGYFVSICFEDGTDIPVFAEKLIKSGEAITFCPNLKETDIAIATGISDIGIVVLLSVIMLLFTIVIMVSATAISAISTSKQIGMLKIAGFSKRAIFIIFLMRASILGFVASFTGGIVSFVLSYVIKNSFRIELELNVVVIVILSGAMVVLLSAIISGVAGVRKTISKTVLECIRPEASNKSIADIRYSSENPYMIYAVKSFAHNSGNCTMSIITAFISVVVITLGLFIGNLLKAELNSYMQPYDFRMDFVTGRAQELFTVNSDSLIGLSPNDYSALCNNKDISDIVGIANIGIYSLHPSDKSSANNIYSDEEYEIAYQKGYPQGSHLIYERLCGVSDDIFEELKRYVIAGDIDVNALKNGTEIVSTNKNHKPGEEINYAIVISNNDGKGNNTDILYRFSVKVGAVIDYDVSGAFSLTKMISGNIWSIDSFEAIGLNANYNMIFLTVENKENYPLAAELLFDIYSKHKTVGDRIYLTDEVQKTVSAKQAYDTFVNITKALCFMLCSFSLISLSCSAYNRLWKRKGIFAILRATGMTKLQLFKLLVCENLLYMFVALSLGAVIGICACLAVTFTATVSVVFPILDLCVLIAVYGLSILFVCHMTVNKFFKITITDSLKNNE